jgi:transcription initiation factor TFIID TATA-box-binding protein
MINPKSGVEVVNIAATGDIGIEIDIEEVVEDIDFEVANYDAEFNAAFLRVEEDEELVILYTSGKYILRGGDDFDQMREVKTKFLNTLSELGIEFQTTEFEVKNVVCVGNLENTVNLNSAMLTLGLENIEYEPEQFPGMIYRPEESSCVLLLFSSGKVVITGGATHEAAQSAFELLHQKLSPLLQQK